MKKTIAAILMMAILLASVFAYSNEQKIYSVDSGVYEAMETLYILAGQSLPSSSGPWSEAELQMMLGRIDKADLSEAAQKYYDYVEGLITSVPKMQFADNLGMEFGLDVALEAYYHTNEEFNDFDDWFHSFTDRAPLLNFSFETWPTDHFYGYFALSFGNSMGVVGDNVLYKTPFTINVPILDSIVFLKLAAEDITDTLNWSFPLKSLVSAGGNQWNLVAGRDRLSWGNGETGNLMLSDSFPVHTFARFNTFFDKFKYSLLGTIYPFDTTSGQFTSLDGYKALIVHRIEFNLFKNKVGLSLNEAAMFWSDPNDDQDFSILQINPFGFMHNEFIARNENSLLVFEANYTPIASVNVYGQFAVDEFSGPGEGRTNPTAFGFLAGAKGAIPVGDGILTGSVEFVKTDPFLYIRGQHGEASDLTSGYGFDAYYRYFTTDGTAYRHMFTTYKYGNDAIILDGRVGYEMPGLFKAGFEAMMMRHGSMDVDSEWHQYNGVYKYAPDVSTPTTFNPFDSEDYDPSTEETTEHAIETSIILSLTGEYNILKGLSATAKADFLIIKNMGNDEGNNQNDVQITVGVKYEI